MNLSNVRKEFKRCYYYANIDYEQIKDEFELSMSLDNREVVNIRCKMTDKKEIYSRLFKLITRFDFSYHLEINKLEDLELYVN